MLVLSRKENEKVLFPNLGIAIEVVRSASGKVRLGIEAPADAQVIRDEIASDDQLRELTRRLHQSSRSLSHEVRNQLQVTLLNLYIVQKQLELNLVDEAEASLEQVIEQLQGLDHGAAAAGLLRQTAAPRRKALIVEDNSNERRLLAGYLSLSGFEVEAVEDGLEALDYLASHERPDAVVMDMQLPRLDGERAVGVLRSDPRFTGLKVYAVSGMDRGALRLPVGPNGVDHWFTKPLDPRQLVELINSEAAAVA